MEKIDIMMFLSVLYNKQTGETLVIYYKGRTFKNKHKLDRNYELEKYAQFVYEIRWHWETP